MAAQIGDGLITTAPDKEVIDTFKQNGSDDRPMYGQVSVCWAKDEDSGLETVMEWWPNAGLGGELSQELPTPVHFKQASKTVRKEDIGETVACGNDPQKHLDAIQKFIDVGIENVYVHQIGSDQEGFLRFYQKHILPEFK